MFTLEVFLIHNNTQNKNPLIEPSTYNHIAQLIIDSGLIQIKKKTKKSYQNFNFENETILITGAAGSIGSELAFQLLSCKYYKLILMDCAESPPLQSHKSV